MFAEQLCTVRLPHCRGNCICIDDLHTYIDHSFWDLRTTTIDDFLLYLNRVFYSPRWPKPSHSVVLCSTTRNALLNIMYHIVVITCK